jgi:uncharacterized protein (UPF0333 family)
MKSLIKSFITKFSAIACLTAFFYTGCATKEKFTVIDQNVKTTNNIYFLVRPESTNSTNGNIYIELYSKPGDTNHYYTPSLSGHLLRIPR